MLTWMRERFGKFVVGAIMSVIIFVFVFFGVISPKNTRGLHEGAVAGTVNGEVITLPEFNREYSRRLEYFRQMTGGKLSEDQLKAFRLKEAVFQELVKRHVLVQEAQRQGREPSQEEVREKIREVPVFQKNGQFDLETYKGVLAANQYTPSSFEKTVRDDSIMTGWENYFSARVPVTDAEIRDEFVKKGNQRKVKYVLITGAQGRAAVKVQPAEVEAYLKDTAKLNLLKNQYESRKDREFKGRSFDDVKSNLALGNLQGEKADQVQKGMEELAEKARTQLAAGAARDGALKALLKPAGADVKTSDWIASGTTVLPGVGEAPNLMSDLFRDKSPIDGRAGGQAKVYHVVAGIIVALGVDAKTVEAGNWEAQREMLAREIHVRKSRLVFENWMKQIMSKAKIDPNPAIVMDQEDAGSES